MGRETSQLIVGIDIGGTKTAVVLARSPKDVIGRISFPTRPELGPDQATRQILDGTRSLLDRAGEAATGLEGIGIICGNPLDAPRGVIQAPPNLSSWKNVEICRIVTDAIGAPCFLENDANAGALAEARFGAGRGAKNFVFLTMGTGFGAGLLIDGQLYRGSTSLAGEIGHVRLTRHGPSGYGKVGSAEGWASGGGMAQLAKHWTELAIEKGEHTLLSEGYKTPEGLSARDVAVAASQGDALARSIVQKVGEKLGETLAILIDLLNPECIAIGGLALRFGDALLAAARDVVSREALPESAKACKVVPAQLGEAIGDIAALCVAMDGTEWMRINSAPSES